MKTLLLCNLLPGKRGAFETFVGALGETLTDNGDELIAVFAGEPTSDVEELWKRGNVHWHAVTQWEDDRGIVKPWRIVLPALEIVKKELPDVVAVHFGNELPTALLIMLSRLFVRKKISWVWHQRQQIKDPTVWVEGKFSQIKILSIVCDHFVALYKLGRDSLLLRGVKEQQISVIFNGVDAYRGQESGVRRELGVAEDEVVVTNVSSLIPRKRLDVTLRAFAKAKKQLQNLSVRLLLIGDGPERENIIMLANELGIMDQVSLLGARNDVRHILNASDLMVLTSDAEACPMVVLEAMSVGLPCVATGAGAAKELIDNGSTGFVVPCGDYEEMSHCMNLIIGDKTLRRDMCEASLRRWKKQFTLKTMLQQHVDLYRELSLTK